MVEKISRTESIEVPTAIAREVKLFINLLQTGEIDSLSDLLQQAGYSKPNLFDLTNMAIADGEPSSPCLAINLDDIWATVTTLIEPPTTRALLSQQSRLVSLDKDKAAIGEASARCAIAICSAKLVKLHQSKIPKIEAALQSALGYEVIVELITEADAAKELLPAIQPQPKSNLTGDRLIARKPLFRPKPGGKGKNKWRILINNSEEATVIEAGQPRELVFQKEIYQYWQVEVQPEAGGKPQTLSILHEDCLKLHSEQIQHFASKKQWSYYFDLSRMFDDVGYAYALTTHKAQGSTIDYVFLDVNDVRGCSDKPYGMASLRQKLLYTALTRAKQQALIPK